MSSDGVIVLCCDVTYCFFSSAFSCVALRGAAGFLDCLCQSCQQSHLDNSHCYKQSFPRSVREETATVSYSRPDLCLQPSRFSLCLRLSPSGLFEHWQYQAPSVQYSRGADLWRDQQQQLNPTPGRTAAHLGGTTPPVALTFVQTLTPSPLPSDSG